jgi:lysozyme
MPLYGVDVSSFQGSPDYAKVKAAGVAFVVAKATEGLGYTDPTYTRNKAAIPAAGLVPGAYHFLRGTHDGVSQAEAFVRAADPHAIHALDVECLDDVRKFNRHLDVPGFVKRYRQLLPGHPLVIYTGRDFWTACAGTATPGPTYGPLWAAGYTPNAYVTGTGSLSQQWAKAGKATSGLPWAGWTSWAICQFTDHATVPGINGGVDGDAFTGTLDDLRALTGVHAPPKPPPHTAADILGPVKYGDTGTYVRVVQHRLDQQLGVKVAIDGVFGRATLVAVEDWQKKHHLTSRRDRGGEDGDVHGVHLRHEVTPARGARTKGPNGDPSPHRPHRPSYCQ